LQTCAAGPSLLNIYFFLGSVDVSSLPEVLVSPDYHKTGEHENSLKNNNKETNMHNKNNIYWAIHNVGARKGNGKHIQSEYVKGKMYLAEKFKNCPVTKFSDHGIE
jgi:hypothetical protein